LWRDSPKYSEDLALTVLDFCSNSADKALADKLFEQMEPKPWNIVAAFIRCYATGKHFAKAWEILDQHLPSFNGTYLQHPLTGMIDTRTAWTLLVKALEDDRVSLANHLLETAASSTEKHIVTIQNWWRHGRATKRIAQPVDVGAVHDVSSRLASIFQQVSLDMDEEISMSLNLFEQTVKKTSKTRRVRFAPSVDSSTEDDADGSTSAGSTSESETESVDNWMTKAAWSPPPGLIHPSDDLLEGFTLPDLPDPWETATVF